MHTFDESYFDAGLDRCGTRSEKWDGTEKESVLPLWVADMDFPSPPEVAERRRIFPAGASVRRWKWRRIPPSGSAGTI